MQRKPRRIVAGILVVLGGLFMWLAPDVSYFGIGVLALGVVIEVVGIYLEHKNGDEA